MKSPSTWGQTEARFSELLSELLKKGGAAKEALQFNLLCCARAWHEEPSHCHSWTNDEWEEFRCFCLSQYLGTEEGRLKLFAKLEYYLDIIFSHSVTILREVRREHDVDDGYDLSPEHLVITRYSPMSIMARELQRSRLSALVELNFAHLKLKEPREKEDWAMRRMSEAVTRATPPQALKTQLEEREREVERFVSLTTVSLSSIELGDDTLASASEERIPVCWGIKGALAIGGETTANLSRRRALCRFSETIVTGEFPLELLGNNHFSWRVGSTTLKDRRTGEIRKCSPVGPAAWDMFREVFAAHRRLDPYREHENYYQETFNRRREIPEEEVISLLEEVLSSSHIKNILNEELSTRGRPLEAFDLFLPISEVQDDVLTTKLEFREPEQLEKALPMILGRIGFKKCLIDELVPRIAIERSRGVGHAFWPGHATDKAHVRCRISSDGMTRGEFSVFLHELGHAVEMVFSTFDCTYRSLRGVPGPAFTEAFALFFERHVPCVLKEPSPRNKKRERAAALLTLFDYAGSALCEVELYRWLYQQDEVPEGKKIQERLLQIDEELWQRYYAPLFGNKSYGFLAGLPHILWGTFYLADYFLGEIIAQQIMKRLNEAEDVGAEIRRMCKIGKISSSQWMQEAVGAPISLSGLLDLKD